jgi:hypothetical protein
MVGLGLEGSDADDPGGAELCSLAPRIATARQKWGPELSGEAKGFLREMRLISRNKEGSHDKSIQLDQKRRLSPLIVEERTDDCRGYHLDECRRAEPIRAGEAHPRGRQISGPSKQWAAMLRLRPVRGACFMQGGGGSGRCERVVPTLHGEARLRVGL